MRGISLSSRYYSIGKGRWHKLYHAVARTQPKLGKLSPLDNARWVATQRDSRHCWYHYNQKDSIERSSEREKKRERENKAMKRGKKREEEVKSQAGSYLQLIHIYALATSGWNRIHQRSKNTCLRAFSILLRERCLYSAGSRESEENK